MVPLKGRRMTKPHEMKWEQSPVSPYKIQVGEALEVAVSVAPWRLPGGDAEAKEQADALLALTKAAPDMVSAMLLMLESGVNATWEREDGTRVNVVRSVRAALQKAGVLP
jgi:hypothetical protein